MPKNLPEKQQSLETKNILTICDDIASSMQDDEKITISITKNGCELTKKTPQGNQNFYTTTGYSEISQGNIKGLPRKEQKAAIESLRSRGFTQAQTAARLNVSQAYVSQIEGSED